MNDDLKKLYRMLGYVGPLEGASPSADDASFAVTIENEPDQAELPPLDAEGLDRFEERLNRNPRKTLSRVREVWDPKMTQKQLRSVIERARRALNAPAEVIAELEAAAVSFAGALPLDFNFPGIDLDEIDIDPEDRRFENDDLVGILGWVFGAGPFVLNETSKKDFRFHNQPQFTSQFIYKLDEPSSGAPLEIALFSDFGVGRYYSRYIAKQFRTRRFPYAIHLGDVYFAGRRSEFAEYFEKLIDPILADTSVFALNSNHEMFSGGIPYFNYISKRAALHPAKQKQEGSYFCLRSERFQIVGIDTAFFGYGRYKEPALVEWLENVLREGRRLGCVNILLSADHPYEYGDDEMTRLLGKDLKRLALESKLVDLWFWGNTHYCALFDHKPAPSGDIPALPFIGSCIGHAGYPYEKQRRGKFEPAPMIFLEDRARFPKETNLRQDKGNNGYCVLQLNADGSIGLQYVDWMSNLRFAASLARGQAGEPLRITPVSI
jgi:Calcineurin-like phosphoesterase